jgi:hypothetical protein
MRTETKISIAVSGILRGYHFPWADGNWLREKHKQQVSAIAANIDLVEIPAHRVRDARGIHALLAEGGNHRPIARV